MQFCYCKIYQCIIHFVLQDPITFFHGILFCGIQLSVRNVQNYGHILSTLALFYIVLLTSNNIDTYALFYILLYNVVWYHHSVNITPCLRMEHVPLLNVELYANLARQTGHTFVDIAQWGGGRWWMLPLPHICPPYPSIFGWRVSCIVIHSQRRHKIAANVLCSRRDMIVEECGVWQRDGDAEVHAKSESWDVTLSYFDMTKIHKSQRHTMKVHHVVITNVT